MHRRYPWKNISNVKAIIFSLSNYVTCLVFWSTLFNFTHNSKVNYMMSFISLRNYKPCKWRSDMTFQLICWHFFFNYSYFESFLENRDKKNYLTWKVKKMQDTSAFLVLKRQKISLKSTCRIWKIWYENLFLLLWESRRSGRKH